MKRSMKRKRVSWAAGVNLCQTTLFRKEEPPSHVGRAKKQLHAKTSCNQYPNNLQSGTSPGFEGTLCEVSHIPSVKWSCPPKLCLNPIWHVASGEESRELRAQSLRVYNALESVYAHSSLSPFSPSISDEPEEAKSFSDSLIPIIPIIPIEELESTILPLLLESYSIDLTTPEKASSLGLPTSTRLGPDVAAAAATLTIPHNGIEQGTTIDMNLLINIITDPELLQKLMNNPPQGNSLSAKSKLAVPSPIPDITGAKLNHPQATVMPFNGSSDGAKSQGPVPRTVTPGHKRKHHQKKCTFYNTSKGCWNGSNCPFRHVPLPTQLQADHLVDEPSVKRIKLNREITGR